MTDTPEEPLPSEFPEGSLKMEPFEVPADFDHGSEFSSEPPRDLPEVVRQSRYCRGRKATVWVMLTIGAACWATQELPFVKMLSWYLLPLGYLNWIGTGLFVLAGYYWLRNVLTWGDLDLIRHGEPLTGRIRQVAVMTEGTAEMPYGRFIAEVDFIHPDTGEMHVAGLPAPDNFLMKDLPKMNAGVLPGDNVTLVYLPGRLDQTMRLYGWTGLNAEQDLIKKNGKPLKPMSPVAGLMYVIGSTFVAWLLLGFVYAVGRYLPLDDSNWLPYVIGMGIAALVMTIILVVRGVDREPAAGSTRLQQYAGMVLAGVLLGVLLGVVSVGFLNCYFDQSPPQLKPVKVVQLWNRTVNFVVRMYEVEYHVYPNGTVSKQMVPVETLASFQPDSLGVMDVGSGLLGAAWLRGFYPIIWQKIESRDDNQPVYPGELTLKMPNEQETSRIIPVVVIPGHDPLPPPEIIIPEARQRILKYLVNEIGAKQIE